MIKVERIGVVVSKRVATVYSLFKDAINNGIRVNVNQEGYPFTWYKNDNGSSKSYFAYKPFQVMNSADIYAPKKLIKEIINLVIGYDYSQFDWNLHCFLMNDEIEDLIKAYNSDNNNPYIYTTSDYSDRVFCLKKRSS